MPGTLERFTVYEGQYVSANDIIGWVEGDEVMRSPFDGLIIHTNARQDQMVSPDEHIAVIADINNIHIEANIRETDIARLQKGQSAIVTIDTFGNRQFAGYISEIGHITSAELTGQAVFFNTGGTFTRVTHLIPIEIVIVDDVNLDSLIGVNARVRISLR
jgi:membrane fusion protein (multidrug efflux system)